MKLTTLCASALLFAGAACVSQAQSIRFLVEHNGKTYEVISGSRTAGKFVNRFQGTLQGRAVAGYTDRVQRGEIITTYLGNRGVAQLVGITVNGSPLIKVPNFTLPRFVPEPVSVNVNNDNIVAFLTIGGRTFTKRVPVGAR